MRLCSLCADRRPNQYPSAAPLPSHYPVPGGTSSSLQQQYPAATHSNPLSGPTPGGQAPPPANPWGFPDPQNAAQLPPPRTTAAPARPGNPPAPPATRPENMSSLTNYSVKVKEQFVLPPSAFLCCLFLQAVEVVFVSVPVPTQEVLVTKTVTSVRHSCCQCCFVYV